MTFSLTTCIEGDFFFCVSRLAPLAKYDSFPSLTYALVFLEIQFEKQNLCLQLCFGPLGSANQPKNCLGRQLLR